MQVQDGRKDQGPAARLFVAFAEQSWDRIFREIVLAMRPTKCRGRSEFVVLRGTSIATIDVSTIFFGVNASCAQCQ